MVKNPILVAMAFCVLLGVYYPNIMSQLIQRFGYYEKHEMYWGQK